MPLKLGKNAYRPADAPTHWHDDPNDEGAIGRLYGNLQNPSPFYMYPVLIHNAEGELTLADNVKACELFKTQFDELILKIKNLATQLSVSMIAVNIYDQPFNVVDAFSNNFLCGFNGITTSKFALQFDPTLFADIKEYIETILNAMLKDVTLAKGTLDRFISAITVCEGGAWADLKIMATEIRPSKNLFGMLEKFRERLVNSIADDHVKNHKVYFDDEENVNIETHVNVFMQILFSLLGRIQKPSISDVNIPKIRLSTVGGGRVVFLSILEATLAVRYLIFLDDFDIFEAKFDYKFEFDNIFENVIAHIQEQLMIIYQRYSKTIEDAVRTTGKSPEEYLDSLNEHEHDIIKNSLTDAKSQCISDTNQLLHAFDATEDAYQLVLNDDLLKPNRPLSLKSFHQRVFWCAAVAAHSLKFNEAIEGFTEECIPSSTEINYKLVSTDVKDAQWIETDTCHFVTPYDYISNNPGSHSYLILNAASHSFLSSFQEAISNFRIIMQDPDAYEEDLTLIQSRYFMKPEFKAEENESELALALQADNVDDIKRLLKQENSAQMLMADNIVTDLIGRSYWADDLQYEIIELMLISCPDMRTALTKEQETSLIEWAIENQRSHLLSQLVNQFTDLNATYTISELDPMGMTLPIFHAAIWSELEDVVDACLARPDLDINQHRDIACCYPTPLHVAAIAGSASITRKLLANKNTDPNIEFSHDERSSPLDAAILYKYTECIKLLIVLKPFEHILKHRLLLLLRDRYGFEEMCDWLAIKHQSLEWYQLLARTRAISIENRLHETTLVMPPHERKLIEDKMAALNRAVENNELGAIILALKLPYPSVYTRFWTPDPSASEPGKPSQESNKVDLSL